MVSQKVSKLKSSSIMVISAVPDNCSTTDRCCWSLLAADSRQKTTQKSRMEVRSRKDKWVSQKLCHGVKYFCSRCLQARQLFFQNISFNSTWSLPINSTWSLPILSIEYSLRLVNWYVFMCSSQLVPSFCLIFTQNMAFSISHHHLRLSFLFFETSKQQQK